MTRFYESFIRPLLFSQDSEKIHDQTLKALSYASRQKAACDALASLYFCGDLPVEVLGLRFPNPVGLAAGMDKQAAAVPVWSSLGFGFSELGGVTWHPQPGNPAPRMFRAVSQEALVNRMGFNNPGAEAMAARLADWRKEGRWPKHPVGINLGKSKNTPLTEAAQDYSRSFRALWSHADFFVVNVSSPNTPGLRQLQDRAALDEILAALQEANHELAQSAAPQMKRPILVKVAPDLSFEALDEVLELMAPRQISGIVATNTTITRPPSDNPDVQQIYAEAGGLSGRPLSARSTECVRHIFRQTAGKLTIIGVGGIFDANDAWDKIVAGASLLQLYTGLVYRGPGVVKEIVDGLRERLKQSGFTRISQAVGSKAN